MTNNFYAHWLKMNHNIIKKVFPNPNMNYKGSSKDTYRIFPFATWGID